MANTFEPNLDGWNQLAKEVIATEGVARMERVAAACNEAAGFQHQGYRVGIEGSGEHLTKHDYRATVITATVAAMSDDRENGTLVKNFYLAGDGG